MEEISFNLNKGSIEAHLTINDSVMTISTNGGRFSVTTEKGGTKISCKSVDEDGLAELINQMRKDTENGRSIKKD